VTAVDIIDEVLIVYSVTDGIDTELDDEDRRAVRKVFVALAYAVNTSEGRLQIIVLDHADDEVWGYIPGVVLTEEWRDKKLIPTRFEMGI
jgi:quinol monooxygenase YgiN